MLKVNLKTASLVMSYLVNADKVREQTDRFVKARERELSYVADGIKVSSANYRMKQYENLKDFITDLAGYVKAARDDGSQIVVFPQLLGMTSIMLMPGFKKIKKEIEETAFLNREQEVAVFKSVIEATQGFSGEIFLNVFSELADKYKIIIAGGGVYRTQGDKIWNTVYCFNENGEVAGSQNKIFLSAKERKWDVSAGEKVTPASTSLGNIALMFSDNLSNYEPFYIARTMGCRISAVAASPFGPDTGCAVFRANETGQCLAMSGLFAGASDFGLTISEKARIVVPYSISPKKDGILKEGSGKVVTSFLNSKKISGSFDVYTADINLDFLKWLINLENGVDKRI